MEILVRGDNHSSHWCIQYIYLHSSKSIEVERNNAYMYELLIVIVFSGGEIPSMADILQAISLRRQNHGEEVQGELQEG